MKDQCAESLVPTTQKLTSKHAGRARAKTRRRGESLTPAAASEPPTSRDAAPGLAQRLRRPRRVGGAGGVRVVAAVARAHHLQVEVGVLLERHAAVRTEVERRVAGLGLGFGLLLLLLLLRRRCVFVHGGLARQARPRLERRLVLLAATTKRLSMTL